MNEHPRLVRRTLPAGWHPGALASPGSGGTIKLGHALCTLPPIPDPCVEAARTAGGQTKFTHNFPRSKAVLLRRAADNGVVVVISLYLAPTSMVKARTQLGEVRGQVLHCLPVGTRRFD
jgi:hypothetical protein